MRKTALLGFCFLFSKRMGGGAMCCREAIRILMESPIYWRLSLDERWGLIKEYIETFAQVVQERKI
jgi:hypothetical protein